MYDIHVVPCVALLKVICLVFSLVLIPCMEWNSGAVDIDALLIKCFKCFAFWSVCLIWGTAKWKY